MPAICLCSRYQPRRIHLPGTASGCLPGTEPPLVSQIIQPFNKSYSVRCYLQLLDQSQDLIRFRSRHAVEQKTARRRQAKGALYFWKLMKPFFILICYNKGLTELVASLCFHKAVPPRRRPASCSNQHAFPRTSCPMSCSRPTNLPKHSYTAFHSTATLSF